MPGWISHLIFPPPPYVVETCVIFKMLADPAAAALFTRALLPLVLVEAAAATLLALAVSLSHTHTHTGKRVCTICKLNFVKRSNRAAVQCRILWVRVCVCTYIYTYMHTYIQIHAYIYMYFNIYAHMYLFTYMYSSGLISDRMGTSLCV